MSDYDDKGLTCVRVCNLIYVSTCDAISCHITHAYNTPCNTDRMMILAELTYSHLTGYLAKPRNPKFRQVQQFGHVSMKFGKQLGGVRDVFMNSDWIGNRETGRWGAIGWGYLKRRNPESIRY